MTTMRDFAFQYQLNQVTDRVREVLGVRKLSSDEEEHIRTLWDEGRLTKWDMLTDDMRASLDRTPFTVNGTGECSRCGEQLATEGDFARHFIVPDLRYLNLGYCPNQGG